MDPQATATSTHGRVDAAPPGILGRVEPYIEKAR
jgi:hypothetical protein